MSKRVFCFILAVWMAVSMMPQIQVIAMTQYDSSAAVSYANAHWNDGVGLCAEFVSNCLKEGGVVIPNNASYYSDSTPSYNGNSGTLGAYTNPYTCSASLLLYLSERYTVITDPVSSDIAVGDVVFMYSGEWRDGHVGIIISTDGGIPIYAAHNRATNAGQFYSNYPCTYVVKMGGSLKVPGKPTITTTTAYYVTGDTVSISWDSVTGNSYYWINVYKNGELIVNQSMGNQTTYTMENATQGEYVFAVSANNSAGTSGGSKYTFLVGQAPQKTTVSTDRLDYAEGDTVTAAWTAETGTTYYWINVYKDGELVVNKSMDLKTSYTIENAEIGEYKITVSANNGAGNSGGSSATFTVSTLAAPNISSSKTHYKVGQTVEVSWEKVDNAVQYIYYLSEYPEEFAYTTNVDSARVTDTTVSFSNLPNGRYRMFVRSISGAGKWSANSNWITFYVYNYDYRPVKTIESNGHIYALFDDEMSWDFAKLVCDEMGGHLVTITSEAENMLVTDLIGHGECDAYWLGANNVNTSDYKVTGQPFQWITGESFNYTNWKAGEPSQSGEKAELEHFLEIRKSYGNQWNDVANSKENTGFILEVETEEYEPTATTTYGNNKYILFDESISWSAAKEYCESIGGHLVTISSTKEDEAVHELIQQGLKSWYFIGASKQNGQWLWVDGEGVPLTDSCANWGDTTGQEQEGPTGWGNCLMKYKASGLWIGIYDFYSPESNMNNMGFVCEIDNAVFSVAYHSNGGTGEPAQQIKLSDQDLILSDTIPTREGYTFIGWTTSSTATVATYQPGESFTTNADTILYAVWEPVGFGLSSVSLSLSDNLTMNFYVGIDAAVAEDAYLQITVGDEAPVFHKVSDAETDESGYYIFAAEVAAAQMSDTITLQLIAGEETSEVCTYSVREYADSVLADETLSEYHELVRAMLNYGAMAQRYFGHNTDTLANAGITVENTAVPATTETQVAVSGSVDGVCYYGATVVLDSKTAVRYYLDVTGDIGDYTFAVGENTYEAVQKNGRYYVEVPGINPQDLEQTVTLTVSNGVNTSCISYSPMNYIVNMYHGNGSDTLKTLLQAMYGYYLAAEAFLAVV